MAPASARDVIRRMAAVLTAMLLILSSATALARDVTPNARVKRAVVVRSAPDAASTAIGRLAPGEAASLDGDDVAGWRRVRLTDGRIGFVSTLWTVVRKEAAGASVAATAAGANVHVIDVGTGLAVFVEGADFTMLYDGGSQDDLADGPDNRIVAYIRAVRPDVKTIDHLVLSHPHKDHVELLPDVFAAFSVRNVWDSGTINRTAGYCRFLKAVQAEPGVLYHDAIATGGAHEVTFANGGCKGTVSIPQAAMMTVAPVTLGAGASMSMLWREPSQRSDPNENSVVVRLDVGGRRLLVAGDAEGGGRQPPSSPPSPSSVEAKLLACCTSDLRADVLVVGHHGSLTSSRRAFLDAVGASVFVVSSGPHPYSRVVLPDDAILAELATRGRVFRTDLDDDGCGTRTSKIGVDADESPGGCSSVLIRLERSALSAGYSAASD